jgi:hypothetical protein
MASLLALQKIKKEEKKATLHLVSFAKRFLNSRLAPFTIQMALIKCT